MPFLNDTSGAIHIFVRAADVSSSAASRDVFIPLPTVSVLVWCETVSEGKSEDHGGGIVIGPSGFLNPNLS